MVTAFTDQCRFKWVEERTLFLFDRVRADIEKGGISGDRVGNKLPKLSNISCIFQLRK